MFVCTVTSELCRNLIKFITTHFHHGRFASRIPCLFVGRGIPNPIVVDFTSLSPLPRVVDVHIAVWPPKPYSVCSILRCSPDVQIIMPSPDFQSMVRFLVTGANKGIGLATVRGLLEANKNAFVFLGSRDAARGQSAVESLLAENSDSYSGRVEALQIDVSNPSSVLRAAETVRTRLQQSGDSEPALGALINNAGMLPEDGSSPDQFASCVDVNFHGVVRTTEAFLPLLESKGRVVMTSSSAGPTFVSKCSPERKALMTDPGVTHAQIVGLADECMAIASGGGNLEERFAAVGLSGVEGLMGAYGLTKVCCVYDGVFILQKLFLSRSSKNSERSKGYLSYEIERVDKCRLESSSLLPLCIEGMNFCSPRVRSCTGCTQTTRGRLSFRYQRQIHGKNYSSSREHF